MKLTLLQKQLAFFIFLFSITSMVHAQCSVSAGVSYQGTGRITITAQSTTNAGWISEVDVNFGDGYPGTTMSSADSATTTYQYISNGTYIIRTSVYSLDSSYMFDCTATDYDTIVVSDISACQLTPATIYLGPTGPPSNGVYDYQFGMANYASSGPNLQSIWHIVDSLGNYVAEVSGLNGMGVGLTQGLYNVSFIQTTYDSLTMAFCSVSSNTWFHVGDSIPPSTCGLQASMSTNVYYDQIDVFSSANNPYTLNYISIDGMHYWNMPDTMHFYNITAGQHNVCYYVEDTTAASYCYDSVCVIVTTAASQCVSSFTLWEDSTNAGVWYGINNSSTPSGSTMYEWNFGDGTYDYSAYPTHTYAAPGNYVICLTVVDMVTSCLNTSCDSSAAFRMSQEMAVNSVVGSVTIYPPGTAVGIDQQELTVAETKLLPNPMAEVSAIAFHSASALKGKLEVVGILGNTVLSEELPVVKGNNEFRFNTASLANGVYYIKIVSGNAVLSTIKAVK